MDWKKRYKVNSYLRSSLWIVPIAAIVLEQIFAALIHWLDGEYHWVLLGSGLEGARTIAGTVITLSLSFVVFTFGSLLVAIQVASGQYTPRIIATTLLSDNVIRYTVGLFVFSLLFAVKALNHIEAQVPHLVIFITGLLGFLCLISFLFFIDYAARMLRPVSLVKRIADGGLAVIDCDYPDKFDPTQVAVRGEDSDSATQTVLHRGTSAILLAVNVHRLVATAEAADGVIELVPQVGDFVGADEPLFLLRGGAAAIDERVLRASVIFGSERTMQQDPLFGVRIIVDIAIKALSAAINDPTTAVLAIDQLQRLLRSVGRRNLETEDIFDSHRKRRVIIRTPNWEDFVHLAFTEIRFYGASNIQIARRLRAMIVNLANTLPVERHPALRQELELLDQLLEKYYDTPEDLALARIPDSQGLGGAAEASGSKWAG